MKRLARCLEVAAIGLGLGASLVLLVDYTGHRDAICTVGGGCEQVKSSALAFLGGIPMPVWGLLFFACMLALRASNAPRRYLWPLSALGAAVALTLLVVQATVVGSFCTYCVAVDMSALVLFLTTSIHSDDASRARGISQASLSLAGALLFLGLVTRATSDESQLGLPHDSASIVEFVDFECPACRALHENLREALEPYAGKIQVLRRHLPLPQHQHAAAAARAYCCAEQAGKAEPMADRLFHATDLTASVCEDIAVQVGVDRSAFQECMQSSLPEATLARDKVAAQDLDIRALPTLFIGGKRYQGSLRPGALRVELAKLVAID